jgi:hypothetical protein
MRSDGSVSAKAVRDFSDHFAAFVSGGPTPEVIWVSGLQSKAYDKTVAMVVK